MKRIDFDNGKITTNILQAALPMLVAQILSLLYNIVDRIYIARIPNIGTAALGAVGLCFPIIVIITAFSNLFGSGGAPLFSIERGRGDKKRAGMIRCVQLRKHSKAREKRYSFGYAVSFIFACYQILWTFPKSQYLCSRYLPLVCG